MIQFTVYGKAEPKGSMIKNRWGAVRDANPRLKDWHHVVAGAAQTYAKAHNVGFDQAVAVELRFALPRPKSLPKKVVEHLKKPDLDKLTRAVLDALTGVLFKDDSQVVEIVASKTYAADHPSVGIVVRPLS
ncbi:MAG: RusA family crossover junction endodeoxyribonuclease [Vicinamibacterales bacterium]|jgi:crossover junction endodeoxyribonuclease RusA|nr:RusA family crossover junction endodeoxyribonuclease [Vicinamibacterales bacterium]